MTSPARTPPVQQRGFTLLEVMIAVAILGIALTSLFGSQSASVALATETRFNTHAPLLARMQLAEILSGDDIFSAEGDFGEDFPEFSWKLQAEETFFGSSELLQQLEGKIMHLSMVVTWGNDIYSYQLDTYRKIKE
ncbi:MAG: prepilin-type N-terminal cleavage/methylation domain-containing protein [Desulfocapsa sp.]|jgi:general secretion pathway protein I|nr:prepilin-type N-terminal cleavage/methylation domain-containing protein [Desulfocapsa sp.]